MRGRAALIVSLLLAVAVLASGCSLINPVARINRVTIEATVAAPSATVKGQLAPGIPANLPLWPGATVEASKAPKASKTKGAATPAWTATLATSDPYIDVVNGVGVGFQKANWQVQALDMSSNESSSTLMQVSNDSGNGVVTVSKPAGKTTVQIDYTITPK